MPTKVKSSYECFKEWENSPNHKKIYMETLENKGFSFENMDLEKCIKGATEFGKMCLNPLLNKNHKEVNI